MKISAIGTGINITNKLNNNNYNRQVSFGVGEDYGNDEFLEINDYQPKHDGNLWAYVKGIFEFFYELIRERTDDDYAFRNSPRADDWGGPGPEKEKELEELKNKEFDPPRTIYEEDEIY